MELSFNSVRIVDSLNIFDYSKVVGKFIIKEGVTMKIWLNPEIDELNIASTQYGAATVTEFDNVYVNSSGEWEGTFKS